MNTVDRFQALAELDHVTGCINWKSAGDRQVYGVFWLDQKAQRANRVAYKLFIGPIPRGLVVRHSCNNKRCVNPVHLKADTQSQNHEDALNDRLMPVGEECARSNLTEDDVRSMRKEYKEGRTSYGKLGKKYGIAGPTVFRIVKRIYWNHI